MKECKKCGKVKDYSQFSKSSMKKDKLQDRCKSCNKVDNHKFRTEINPEHHAKWQKEHPKRVVELVAKYRKGDKAGIVYALINPKGDVYVGQTKTYLQVRIIEHKVKYRRFLEGKVSNIHPLLFQSFEKYGFENHKVKVLFEDKGIDRKALKQIETTFIQAYKQKGNSLNKIL